MSPIAILGAGSWGTALAGVIARNGYRVNLWGKNSNIEEMILTRRNEPYLPDLVLDPLIEISQDLQKTLTDVHDILIAVPSAAFREVLNQVHSIKPHSVRIAWATKGLGEANQLLQEIVLETYGEVPLAIIAGPSFAKEVAARCPTAITLTSQDSNFSKDLVERLHGHLFRVYTQNDLIGVQVCGATKNPLAIAVGISDGLGFGANARSALITRGLAEMARLGLAMGGKQETFMGLAGLGDLVLTCTDDQSRNRRFGYAIGAGSDMEEAEKSIGQVVEGRSNAFKVIALAEKYGIEMPITEHVCRLLKGQITPSATVESLFARDPKSEKIGY